MIQIKKRQFVKLHDGAIVYVTDICEDDDIALGDIDDHGGRRVFYKWQVKRIVQPVKGRL